jgi:DNA-binding LacI/PurR family transcriptional regulator
MLLFGWSDPQGFETITHYARDHGWHLELRAYFTDNVPDHWRGDGILYSKGNRERIDRFVAEQATRCPVVSLNANLPTGLELPIVAADNAEAGRIAARHLIAQGHEDFAYYSPVSGMVSTERQRGFEETILKSGHRLHPLSFRTASANLAGWAAQRRQLAARLAKLPPRVGMLALDDLMAVDLIEVSIESGRRVPEDFAVVGLGNLGAVCQCSPIPITSIDMRADEIARRGAELLGRLMAGGKRPAAPLHVTRGEMIVRESSDTTIVSDPRLAAAIALVRKNLRRSLSLEQVADAAGVSRRTLYHLFQDELGLTPAAFIKRQRSQLVNRLLSERPDMTRDEAARSAGFACTRTMSRMLLRKA